MKRNILLLTALAAVMISPVFAEAASLQKKKAVPEVEAPKQDPMPAIVVAPEMLNGEWMIKAVGSTAINVEENYPYIHFVSADNAFYASNGCNVLNGVFTVADGNKMTFHNVLSTMKYCPDTPFEQKINAVLADENTVSLRYESIAGEGYLYLNNARGQRVMTLRKPGMDFLNGNWRVVEINNEDIDNPEMTIFFDIEERRVHGNTGCNYFNGEIFLDPVNANSLSLSKMGVTRRMCPNADDERKLLVALEDIAIAISGDDSTALLTDASGHTAVKLVRIYDNR